MKKIFRSRTIGILFIVTTHLCLLYWLAESETVAKLFAPGTHTQILDLSLALLFLITRLLSLIYLPALAAGMIGATIIRWILSKNQN